MLDTRWLALLFIACALPTGLCLALLTPMGQVADEPAHIARAAGLLHGQIMGQRFSFTNATTHDFIPLSGTSVNSALVAESFAELPPDHLSPTTPAMTRAAEAIPWSTAREFDAAPNTVQYFPALYLPGTLGIALMRYWGGSPLQALHAGRVAMLLASLAIGAAAIAIAAYGRTLLFALLSLPMMLGLASSFNEDGPLIAATALTGALLTLDPREHPRLRFAALPVFALVLCSKPPYGLLMLAFLCPLAASGLARRLIAVALFALPPLIWVALMMHMAEVPINRPAYHPGPFWPGDPNLIFHGADPAANLRVLLTKPSRLLHMQVAFFANNWFYLVRQGIGYLGWLTVKLANWAYIGWGVALACAAISVMFGKGPGLRWRPLDALFVLALVISSSFAIAVAIYLSWDRVGQSYITGVQGRYFLMFIPFIVLALPRFGPRRQAGGASTAQALEAALALPAVIMALVDTGYLPWLIVHFFYLR